VAPLTATVLSDADESNAGIASGINNAVARVAGLLSIAAVGAVISAQFAHKLDAGLAGLRLKPGAAAALAEARRQTLARADPAVVGRQAAQAVQAASVHAFHVGMLISAILVAAGGLLGLAGIRNPRRDVKCADCPGGQFAGQPKELARLPWPGEGNGAGDGAGNLPGGAPADSVPAGGAEVSAARRGPSGSGGGRSGDRSPGSGGRDDGAGPPASGEGR
jgi:hypothetical protein